LRAYALWQREGQPEGHAERHWQEAKAAIAAEEATQNIDARMAITRDHDEHPAPGGASPGANEDAAQQTRFKKVPHRLSDRTRSSDRIGCQQGLAYTSGKRLSSPGRTFHFMSEASYWRHLMTLPISSCSIATMM
jgi:hypothetical protein